MASNSYGWVQPYTFGPGGKSAPQRDMAGQQAAYSNAQAGYGQQFNNMGAQPQFQGQGFADPSAPAAGRGRDPNQGGYGGSVQGGNSGGNPYQGIGPGGNPLAPNNTSSGVNSFLNQWAGVPGSNAGTKDWSNPSAYASEGYRNMMEGYNNYFAVPYFNAQLAAQTQNYNELSGNRNFGEQQRVNTSQMDLANRGSSREDLALQYGQGNNTRDFGEAQRQFNQQQGLAARTQEQLNSYNQGQLGNQAQANQYNYSLGQGQNKNAATANANTLQLGLGQNQNAAQANQYNYLLGQGQNTNQATANANQLTNYNQQYALGKTQNANTAQNNAWNYALGQGQNTNAANANANTLTLGQGQLGYQNRQLDTTNAFNQKQLSQEAALSREKYANDLMQTRYQTYGRGLSQNPRSIGGWK